VEHHRRTVQLGFLLLATINTYSAYIVWPQSHVLGLASGTIAVVLLVAAVFAT
jgi:branched-subunit amino acid transport protein AzlD